MRARRDRLPQQLVGDHIYPQTRKLAQLFGKPSYPQQRVPAARV